MVAMSTIAVTLCLCIARSSDVRSRTSPLQTALHPLSQRPAIYPATGEDYRLVAVFDQISRGPGTKNACTADDENSHKWIPA